MTTYNRPLELEKSIEYWRDTPVTVHILDGSDKSWFPVGVLDGIPTITYHHIPCEKNLNPMLDFMRRIVVGAELSNTNYSAICNDDDFYPISQLLASIKYLKKNLLFDAVCGRVLTYQKITQQKIIWWCKYLAWRDNKSAQSESLSERALGKKNWFLYAVARTELWKKFINMSYSENLYSKDQFYAHEWLMKQLSASLFKTKFLESICTVRQVTQYGVNVGDVISWKTWLVSAEYELQVAELTRQLAMSMSLVSGVSSECEHLARRLIENEVLALQPSIKKSKPSSFFRQKFLTKIARSFPEVIKNLLTFLMPAEVAIGMKSYRLRLIQQLLTRWGVSFDKEELKKIEKLLLMPREELRLRANI